MSKGNKNYMHVCVCVGWGGGWRSGLLYMSFLSCDADPAALAKYVVALLRKDKPKSDLKDLCIDQLEVFLAKGEHLLSALVNAVVSCLFCPAIYSSGC